MVIVKSSTCDSTAVTRLVQSHVAGAQLRSDVAVELSYVLPQESKVSFSQLFTELDKNKSSLGIVSYGASVTTMDEVFVRLPSEIFSLAALTLNFAGYFVLKFSIQMVCKDGSCVYTIYL